MTGSATTEPRSLGEWRALAIAGGLALVLSLGPALKVYDVAVPIPVPYDVPERLTTLPLPPLRWLYESAPGFNDMRATYRWFIATRFVLIFGGGLALAALYRRPGRNARVATIVIAAVLVAETIPDIPENVRLRRLSADQTHDIRAAILPEARRLIRRDELVLALPVSGNDFLTFAIIPTTGARSYNVGIDKNVQLSVLSWPATVRATIDRFGAPSEADTVCQAFSEHVLDALVLPYFDLFASTFTWPPSQESIDVARTRAAQLGEEREVHHRSRHLDDDAARPARIVRALTLVQSSEELEDRSPTARRATGSPCSPTARRRALSVRVMFITGRVAMASSPAPAMAAAYAGVVCVRAT